jgi:predicted transcriptional regulator
MKDINSGLISVKNRNNGTTVYKIPDKNIVRTFAPGETKQISLDELKELQWIPGGEYLLKNLLIVDNKVALDALNMKVEPEYFYTEDDIRKLLTGMDNMDEFLDFLDFATEGAIDIAKDIAVKERIPDSRKREALSAKTGFNIDSAINMDKLFEEEENKPEPEKKERRVKAVDAKEEEAPKRRVAISEKSAETASKYKIISK